MLAVVFLMLEFLKMELTPKFIILTLVIAVITVLFIVFSSVKRTDYYSSFWVESVPILWLLLHLVF